MQMDIFIDDSRVVKFVTGVFEKHYGNLENKCPGWLNYELFKADRITKLSEELYKRLHSLNEEDDTMATLWNQTLVAPLVCDELANKDEFYAVCSRCEENIPTEVEEAFKELGEQPPSV